MSSINTHLSINSFTFNTDWICKLLYMIVTLYQTITLYNKVFFGLVDVFTYTQNPSKV